MEIRSIKNLEGHFLSTGLKKGLDKIPSKFFQLHCERALFQTL
jgi:hypothetical protein